MAVDQNLFAARRLGFGLKIGDDLPAPPRDWAMEQVRSIPKLDFYGQDGTSIAAKLPAGAVFVDYPQSCISFGQNDALGHQLQSQRRPENEFWPIYAKFWKVPQWSAALATTLSAVNGPSPVFERFWQFWCNHFTASVTTLHGNAFYGAHIQTIRSAMTGSFADMLFQAVGNPAILYYLDNIYSVGPHSQLGRKFSLNENLGRELLELYSVSPEAGYTQQDVIESAMILTGWTFSSGPQYQKAAVYYPGAKPGLLFDRGFHEPGPRKVMGKTYAAANTDGRQLKELTADLGVHPSAAKFIATKLTRAFVADNPPQDSIDRIAQVFASTKGNLVAVHSAVIDEALTVGAKYAKFTKPSLWLQQVHKALGIMPNLDVPTAEHLLYGLPAIYDDLGEPFGAPPQPNGWPDTEADWLSKAMLDRRVRYISNLPRVTFSSGEFGDYVDRLAGPESLLSTSVKRAQSEWWASILLFVSPQFLRV